MRRLPVVPALVVLALLLGRSAAVHAAPLSVGPAERTTGNGRVLHPIGTLTTVGDFPTGLALSPDGRFAWVVDSGHGRDDVQIVSVASGKVVQVLPLPGAFGGVAFAPDGHRAWVSGTPSAGAKSDNGTVKGGAGDVLHVFDVDPASGHATEKDPVTLPAGSGTGTGQVQSLPPVRKAYPAGVAVSPDGHWVGVAEQQADQAVLVDARTGATKAVAVGRYPTGALFDRTGRLLVTNAYDGTVSVISPASAKVVGTVHGLGGTRGDRNSQPEGMVLDPVADRLYVAVSQRDLVAVVDLSTLKVTHTVSVARSGQPLGVEPVALGVDPAGASLYVTDANEDTLAVVALRDRPGPGAATRARTVVRPPSVATLQRYVRVAADRRASAAARRRAARANRGRTLRACQGPTRAQVVRYRRQALAALRHRRADVARHLLGALRRVRACPAAPGYVPNLKALTLVGRLPTAAYPTAAAVTPDGARLLWLAGKGFGAGPNPQYAYAGDKRAFGKVTTDVYGQYVLDALSGRLGRLALPTDRQVVAMTKAAEAQAVPADSRPAPAGTPVRSGGPIKHVFLIVRENRTYDQIFGSDPRGNGDPNLEVFDDNGVAGPTGGMTPNAHKLTRTFPLLDNFYEDSEVSVDGHLITAGTIANDYVQKGTAQNYSRPGKSYDFGIAPISFGPNDFLFDQAVRQKVTFRNYGEQAAGILPFGADGRPTYPQVLAGSDNAYPGPAQIGCLAAAGPGANLASCFQDSGRTDALGTATGVLSRTDIFRASFLAQAATGTVPAFNYLILPNDHSNGTTKNAYTPQAFVADNDLGLGQIVDTISHSPIWGSSAIFVIEDDSQDGADHVDAHRAPALVISPWTRRGAVVHTRYDQYSVLRTAELMAGLAPLSTNDALAVPMYDAFVSGGEQPDVEGTRYTAVRPTQPLDEVNGAAAPLRALSDAMPFDHLDLVPQAVMDQILWAAVRGTASTPPSPGPHASPEEHARALGALREVAAGRSPLRWLISHGGESDDDHEAPTATRSAGPDATARAQAASEARALLARLR
ncbi:bifunctional YncE family protein/alkaline phosphatase family protein [Paraconexibacter antarcticus]|uniref:Bifunctional YncE family protein/alkaline phosphatase family protein n=1 Tax=Paraconexibacter antarcticus TaxID=2949664 RepID=A0ABY5DWA2_9ACTN|nr:bifunctional YncE family protein/alkaline phosphatase family protein [Paraconexibacter antarcticus]UTI66291.1 bifunctional YncE family protein/alkaline phosphatase family protein [Paraconexibacter antarcticus]